MIAAATLFGGAALLLLAMAINGLRRHQLSSLAFAALSGYSLMSVVSAHSLVEAFGEERYLESSAIYLAGSVMLSLSTTLFSWLARHKSTPMPKWDHGDFEQHANYSLVLAFASVVLLSIDREDLLAAWNTARAESGLLTFLAAMSLLLASPGIVSAWIAKRRASAIVLSILCCISFTLLGSRAALICSLVFAFWLWLMRARGIGPKLQIFVLAAVTGFAAHFLLRYVRGLGVVGLLDASSGNDFQISPFDGDSSDLSGGEGAIVKYFVFSTTISSVHDFGFMTSIQRLFLILIPRVHGWIDKPVDVTYLFWKKAFELGMFADADGRQALLDSYLSGSLGSLHPTLFGEYYLAGGWVSLMLSTAVVGAAFAFIDLAMQRMARMTSLALCGPVLVGFLFVARGNSIIGLGYFFHLYVIFSLLRFSANRILRLVGYW